MRLIKTILPNEIWEGEYEGKTVQFIKNVFTNEIMEILGMILLILMSLGNSSSDDLEQGKE